MCSKAACWLMTCCTTCRQWCLDTMLVDQLWSGQFARAVLRCGQATASHMHYSSVDSQQTVGQARVQDTHPSYCQPHLGCPCNQPHILTHTLTHTHKNTCIHFARVACYICVCLHGCVGARAPTRRVSNIHTFTFMSMTHACVCVCQ